MVRSLVSLFLIFLICITTAALAEDRSESLTLQGLPITIEFAPGDRRVADRVAEICLEAIPRLADEMGLTTVRSFHVVLTSDIDAFQREHGITLPSWGIAFAFMSDQVMVVDVARATSAWNSLEHVIPHELSHLLVGQRVDGITMPIWFVEGLAVWQAGEWSLMDNWQLMEAVWSNRTPSLARIHSRMPADEAPVQDAYRVSYSAITNRFDDDFSHLPFFLDEVVREGDFSSVFERYFGESELEFYARFDELLHNKYRSRLLLFQAGPLFSIVAVLFLIVYLRVFLRNRRKMRRLEELDRGYTGEE